MFEPTKQTIGRFASMLENDELTNNGRDVLQQSLFYYCSGKDPTPIVAFGAKILLYVFVDSFVYMKNNFSDATEILCNRLKKLNFRIVESRNLNPTGKLQNVKNAQLTVWETRSGDGFALLFVQGDAVKVFTSIYGNLENCILPKCICNYKYEMSNLGILAQVEKRVEYVFGHCFSQQFRCVEEYDYYGDYAFGSKSKVKLYHKVL